ncbi:VOC family protein [Massilia putida]|uniref:VOC family protein n=1 Tax=Massilia putida TaxID=1141883 RepID=UPI000950EE37|nr:VOC family protein [Massilia putida]
MNILGPDTLVFGVDDVAACKQCLKDYGLVEVAASDTHGVFEALDGTSVVVRHDSDPALPPPIGKSPNIRAVIYGVKDRATLAQIKAELSKDRDVREDADGSIHAVDDIGLAVGFQVSVRRPYEAPAVPVNVPGRPAQRPVNQVAADPDAALPVPRSLSHVVLFVPDVAVAERFYVERLGFRVSDRFTGTGPFLRPAGCADHHTLFLIQAPAFMKGINHFTFHMGSVHELLRAGAAFAAKGYKSFWGPGRHIYGSNWFWYFNSPLGGTLEYDADMDTHDDSWTPRECTAAEDTSQVFLFSLREPWFPSGGNH